MPIPNGTLVLQRLHKCCRSNLKLTILARYYHIVNAHFRRASKYAGEAVTKYEWNNDTKKNNNSQISSKIPLNGVALFFSRDGYSVAVTMSALTK